MLSLNNPLFIKGMQDLLQMAEEGRESFSTPLEFELQGEFHIAGTHLQWVKVADTGHWVFLFFNDQVTDDYFVSSTKDQATAEAAIKVAMFGDECLDNDEMHDLYSRIEKDLQPDVELFLDSEKEKLTLLRWIP